MVRVIREKKITLTPLAYIHSFAYLARNKLNIAVC